MRIYRIDHVGQVAPELEPQVELLTGLFGFRPVRRWDSPAEGCRGVRLAIPGSWGHIWEVLAPAGDDSAVQAFLDGQGGRPGLHHVAAEVPDLGGRTCRAGGPRDQAHRWGRGELAGGLAVAAGARAGRPVPTARTRRPGNVRRRRRRRPGPAPVAADPPDAPSLGIVGLDHICQAFPDRDELARWYADLAGFVQVWRTPEDEHPDMADLVLNVPGSTICWEVIMPRGEDSFIERFWTRNGAAAHHVTFEVADWERALEACRHHEIPTFGENEGSTDGAAWRDAFVHPKHTGGVLVQLFWEERPGVWVRSDKIPPVA